MYVRVAEFSSTSDIKFDIFISFLEHKMLPRNIEAGQISGEIFKTSSNSGFVVSRFNSKIEADKIMSIMRDELTEIMGDTKIKLIEGPRIFNGIKKQ